MIKTATGGLRRPSAKSFRLRNLRESGFTSPPSDPSKRLLEYVPPEDVAPSTASESQNRGLARRPPTRSTAQRFSEGNLAATVLRDTKVPLA